MQLVKEEIPRLKTNRTVAGIVNSIETLEGGGFPVRRPFPKPSFSDFDPFLLLDEMGPVTVGPNQAKGAPDHPHRGFETVTYMLSGEMEHKDSHGHGGKLTPGDVQWMTAGAGVVHSEMPSASFQQTGGTLHGFQLWVNLPRTAKMMRPRHQEIPSSAIPTVTTQDGSVKVRIIAGEALGARAVIETVTPIIYLHYSIQPGGEVSQPVPLEYNAFAYVVNGQGLFGDEDEKAEDGQMVMFAPDGGEVTIRNSRESATALELLLIAGVPLNEPVTRYGPFVMNTKEEIFRAIEDYQAGRMGAIDF